MNDDLKNKKINLVFSKNDINNNSAKARQTPETNDDDDVETVRTADAETLLPEKHLNGTSTQHQNGTTKHHQILEHDYPSDPNETDQVS
jgi:hypothetical protein